MYSVNRNRWTKPTIKTMYFVKQKINMVLYKNA